MTLTPQPLQPAEMKFHRLMDDSHTLCKEEIVWILAYIKQKTADGDSALRNLHQPRLLRNFYHYAEIALMLLQPQTFLHEQGRLKKLLREASFGLGGGTRPSQTSQPEAGESPQTG